MDFMSDIDDKNFAAADVQSSGDIASFLRATVPDLLRRAGEFGLDLDGSEDFMDPAKFTDVAELDQATPACSWRELYVVNRRARLRLRVLTVRVVGHGQVRELGVHAAGSRPRVHRLPPVGNRTCVRTVEHASSVLRVARCGGRLREASRYVRASRGSEARYHPTRCRLEIPGPSNAARPSVPHHWSRLPVRVGISQCVYAVAQPRAGQVVPAAAVGHSGADGDYPRRPAGGRVPRGL